MEFKLECFELSGLVHDFSALPHHDQFAKDYQIKILADEGLAFDSSWVMGINDEDTGHICWPDEIALECDPPLVGMRMHLAVICRTIDGTCTSIFKGDLQVESWDGIIDAILGVSESRDILRSFDAVSNTMTATTIVGVPMHKLRVDSAPTPVASRHHTTMFIRISIKAVPLEALDSPMESPAQTPTPQKSSAQLATNDSVDADVDADEVHAYSAEEDVPDAATTATTATAAKAPPVPPPATAPPAVSVPAGNTNIVVVSHQHAQQAGDPQIPDDLEEMQEIEEIEDEEEVEEDVQASPAKEDIARAVESIVPFVESSPCPPPPPPLPIHSTSSAASTAAPTAAPATRSRSASAPAPAHPVITRRSAAAAEGPSANKPPPAPPTTATIPAPTVPPPPPAPSPAQKGPVKGTPGPAQQQQQQSSDAHLNTEAALNRAHAPAGRHHKSRASFVFVPTAEEDTQGIPLAPVPTAPASGASGAVPPKAPPVPPTVFLEPPVSPDVAGNSASHPPPPPSASPAEPARIVSATSDQHVAGGSRRLTLAEVGATKVSSTTKAASSPDTPPPPLPSSDGKGGKKPATPAVAKSVPSKPAVAAASAASAAKETAAPPSEGVDVGNLQQLLKTAQDENVRLKTQLCASEDLNKTLQNDCEKYQKTLAAVKAEYEDKMFLAAKAAETSQNALSAHLASLQAELLQNKSIFATLTTQLEQRTAELKAITATSATSPVPSPQGSGTSAATSATGAAGATAQSPFGRSSFSFRTHTRTRSDGSIPPFVLNDTSTTAVSAGVTAAGAGGVSAAGSTTTGTGAVNTSMVIPAALTVGATAGTGLSSAGSFSSSPSERIAQRRGSLIAAATAAVTTTAAVSSTADALAGDSSTSNAAVPLVSAPSVPQSASKVPFSAPPASELHLDVVNHTPLKIRTSSDSNSVLGYSPPLPPSTPVASAAPAVHASAGGGDVPTVGLIRIPSSSALPSLFPNTSENGDCDFEEAELATLPFQQKSKFRPKSHSVKLDGDQFHLQAMLKAEMEKKTPRQRLRPSNDVGILETSSWALGATNSPIPPRGDTPTTNSPMPGGSGGGGAGGGVGGVRDASSPLNTSLQPTAGDITDSRKLSTRDHRLKDSTAELQAFAAQAAAKAMADDKRQSLIAEGHITSAAQVGVPSTGISGGSTAGAPSQGVSLLRRTLVANTSASSNVSLSRCSSPAPSSADSPMMSVSQGIYWEEGNNSAPSAGTSVSSRSPNPSGVAGNLRRMGSSIFSRRRTNSDGSNLLAEGGSGAGSGAAAGVTGGVDATSAAVIDDEEIANTIRELTASLRLSPSLDSLQNGSESDIDRCSTGPSPVQHRVLQRMIERRRSNQQQCRCGWRCWWW